MFQVLREREITSADTFYDLGSGNGRLALQMQLLTPIIKSVGIELSPTRHAQALLAQSAAHALRLDEGSGQLELFCADMLQSEYGGATLIFSYNLCLSNAFMGRMERHLLAQLPVGACVLLHGRGFPPPVHGVGGDLTDAAGAADSRANRLELRLRLSMWYGYCVVPVPSNGTRPHAAAAAVRRPQLRQTLERLGTTRFEREIFVES